MTRPNVPKFSQLPGQLVPGAVRYVAGLSMETPPHWWLRRRYLMPSGNVLEVCRVHRLEPAEVEVRMVAADGSLVRGPFDLRLSLVSTHGVPVDSPGSRP